MVEEELCLITVKRIQELQEKEVLLGCLEILEREGFMDIDGHLVKIDLNKVEYELGVSYKQALSMVTRLVNEAYDLIHVLQNRVSELERYAEKTQGYL